MVPHSAGRAHKLGWGLLLGLTGALAAAPLTLVLDAPLVTEEPATLGGDVVVQGQTMAGAEVTLLVRGAAAQVLVADAAGRFQFSPVLLLNGPNELAVSAVLGDQTVTARRVVTGVRQPPPLTLAAPLDRPTASHGDARLTLVGRTAPGLLVTVTQNGREATATADGDGGFTLPLPAPLVEGENLLHLRVSDAAGLRTTLERRVLLDTTPPELALLAPFEVDGAVTRRGADLRGRTEPGATVLVRLNDQALAPAKVEGDGLFTLGQLALQEGENLVVVTVTDPAGNQTSVARRITRDTSPPGLQLAAPLAGPRLRTAEPYVTLAGVGAPGREVRLRAGERVVGTVVANADGAFAFGTLALAEGDTRLVVETTDEAGNAATVERLVSVDRRAPALQVYAPGPVDYVETAGLTLAGRTERGAALTLQNAASEWRETANVGGFFRFADVPLTDGVNAFALTVADDVGNRQVVPVTVTARVSNPAVEILSPTAGWLPDTAVTATVRYEADALLTLTLDDQPLQGWRLGAPNGEVIPQREARLDLGALPAGPHELRAVVVSPSGQRRNEAVRRFHVPGPSRSVRLAVEPRSVPRGGQATLAIEALDEWGQPVADGSPVVVELPTGWTAGGRGGAVSLTTRLGKATLAIKESGRGRPGLVLVSVGRMTESLRLVALAR